MKNTPVKSGRASIKTTTATAAAGLPTASSRAAVPRNNARRLVRVIPHAVVPHAVVPPRAGASYGHDVPAHASFQLYAKSIRIIC